MLTGLRPPPLAPAVFHRRAALPALGRVVALMIALAVAEVRAEPSTAPGDGTVSGVATAPSVATAALDAVPVVEAVPALGPAPALAPVPGVEATPPLRTASYIGSAIAVSAASAALSIFLVTRFHDAGVQATGRPITLLSATGVAVGLGLDFALMHLLAPELTRLANTDNAMGAVSASRERAWQLSRWAWLGGALGAATTLVGAGLEQGQFGRGQAAMIAGLGTVLVSALVANVLELLGAWQGAQSSRVAR